MMMIDAGIGDQVQCRNVVKGIAQGRIYVIVCGAYRYTGGGDMVWNIFRFANDGNNRRWIDDI